jgi:hypothetical protein
MPQLLLAAATFCNTIHGVHFSTMVLATSQLFFQLHACGLNTGLAKIQPSD